MSYIFAGLSLTYMRAYKIGDLVKIGETVGDVIEIKMYGSRTAFPDPYLPKDYEPRALRVFQNPTAGEEGWRTGGKEPEK